MVRNDKPDLRVAVTEWDDGEVEYGFGDVDPEFRLYVLARRRKTFDDLKRTDDGLGHHVDEYDYQFFDPDQLTVQKRDDMAAGGWEFRDVSIAEFNDAIHDAFGDG